MEILKFVASFMFYGNKNKGGSFNAPRRLAIRLVAGSWCILAFVLVTAYQSVLISYILAPGMEPPIVDSFADLANKTNVRLLVEKGWSIDDDHSIYIL
jgi:hypothetical protein